MKALQTEPKNPLYHLLPKAVFLCSLVFLLFSLFKGWHGAIHDMHPFRQTQTAITVSYLLKGGPWLGYQTPVLGPPWTIPFEFPLYQWLVALTTMTGLFALEQAGRCVSIAMFLATLYPFYRILKALKLAPGQIYLVLTLYCLCPQYLFWSRTFMIESTALALAMYYLLFVVLYRPGDRGERKGDLLLIGIGVLGALAAVVKITTFFAFCAAGMLFFGYNWFQGGAAQGRWSKERVFPLLKFLACAGIVPLVALVSWTSYSDALKSLSVLGQDLTSAGLWEWNFGTWEDKLSPKTWQRFFFRIGTDLVGNSWLGVAAVAASLGCRKETRYLVFVLLLLFLLPLATFSNLHFRHNYYAYANGVFLIAAVGMVVSELWQAGNLFKRLAGVALFVGVVGFSSYHYLSFYYPKQGATGDLSFIKKDMDRMIASDDAIMVVFGADWSSELPYYLDRRAVMLVSEDLGSQRFADVKRSLSSHRVGAIVFFGKAQSNPTLIRGALAAFDFAPDRMKNYGQMLAFFNR